MAIAVAHLTSAGSITDAASYTTASITPTANALVLAWVRHARTASLPAAATLAGNGLTWVQVATVEFQTIASPTSRLTLYRALGATPAAGTVTITCSNTQIGCTWSIVEYTGAETAGTDGSGAVVQSATHRLDSSPASLTVTLAAYANAAHLGACGFAWASANAGTPGTNWSQTGTATISATPTWTILTTQNTTNDTTADASAASANGWAGIAVEIAAAAAAAGAPVTALFNRGLNAPLQVGVN